MEHHRSRPESIAQREKNSLSDWLSIIRTLLLASDAIFDQAQLHGRLAKVEWAQEKHRLTAILFTLLFGLGCFIGLLIFLGVLVLALSWSTEYRLTAIVVLCGIYGLMLYVAWQRLRRLGQAAAVSFVGTRTEIAADIALIRNKLL